MKCVAYSLITILCLAATSRGAEFFGLGDLPGGRYESAAFRVSGDGSTVVGYSGSAASGTRNEAFRWTRATGMVSLGDLAGGDNYGAGIGVSYNGSVIVGDSHSTNGEEAFRWTSSTGMVGQGDLPGGFFSSQFQSVSADGNVAVGDGCSIFGTEATRWSAATGLVGLGDFSGGQYLSQSIDVSADGSVIVGQGYPDATYSEAFRWTQETGMVGLGDLPGGDPGGSVATAVSADGRVIVGQGRSAIGGEAFRWTAETGMVGLGTLGGVSGAMAVSGDGSVIVGQSDGPFIWTEATGMRNLKDVLEEQGIDLGGWNPYAPRGISWDGRVIVGYGNNPHFDNEAWMAILSTNDSSTGGDTDDDGDVDLDDLNNVRNHFGEMGVPVSGDTNEDYIVDLDDLNAVRNNFGRDGLTMVPEPASFVLIASATIALGAVRWNRWRIRGLSHSLQFVLKFALFCSLSSTTIAAYTFNMVASRSDELAGFARKQPSISDTGAVVFHGYEPSGDISLFIAANNDVAELISTRTILEPPAINSMGQVAVVTSPTFGLSALELYTPGVGLQTLDFGPEGRFGLGIVDLTDSGLVAYTRSLSGGYNEIVKWSDNDSITIVKSSMEGFGDLRAYAPAMNEAGNVVFWKSGSAVLVGVGGEESRSDYLVDITIPPGRNAEEPAINDAGEIAISSDRFPMRWDGNTLKLIADTTGPFAVFGNLTISNSGAIAFYAAMDDGSEGIFLELDDSIIPVVRTGDSLGNSTVRALRYGRHGINNHDQLAFWALLDDGVEGIFVATPDAQMNAGDTNSDGIVDLEDLNNVRNNFGGTGLGDTNNDGVVDLIDLNNVRNFFGFSAPQAVPEPSSLALLALGAAGIVAGRRRMARR